ncbi:GNVR domain-containing protein [Marinitoga lauensis]|uniref:GNVR domain-containing protein n=1 Tax=Marinitoga lauensis TaxID=2201189 RepID=UPI0010123D2E|nr:GNVR domain-containing protein [Marinitoga lauensis]
MELETTLKTLNKEYNNLLQQALNQDKLAFLASIDRDLYKEYTTVISALDNMDLLKSTYQGILEKIDKEINKRTGPAYEYLKLKKDQKITELKYQMYLNNLENEKLKITTLKDKFIIIDKVYVPESSVAPNKKMGLAIGFIFSIFFSIFVVNLKETLNTKIDDIYKLKEVYGNPDFIISNPEDFANVAIYAKLNNKKKIGILFSNSTDYLKEEVSEILFFHGYTIITAHKEKVMEHFNKFKSSTEYQAVLIDNVESFEYTLYKDHLDEIYIIANKYKIKDLYEVLNKNTNVKVIYIKG